MTIIRFQTPQEMLRELDPNEMYISGMDEPKDVALAKERDVLKEMTLMTGGGATYAILGIEAQSYLDHGMVVRNMIYDAARYAKELRELAQRNSELHPNLKGDSFLTGLLPGDRIHPVVTMVLYLSHDEWTAPRSLHELLDTDDPEILKYVQDYRLNIVCPHDLGDNDILKYRTDLGAVLLSLKYGNNKKELLRKAIDNPLFKKVRGSSVSLISKFTGMDFGVFQDKETVDMTQKLMTMEECVEELAQEYAAEEVAEAKAGIIVNLYKSGISLSVISKATKIPLEQLRQMVAKDSGQGDS